MDILAVIALYCVGLFLIVLEALLPGMVLGVSGALAIVTAVVYGFDHGVLAGFSLLGTALIVVPWTLIWGMKRLSHKTTLSSEDGVLTYRGDYGSLVGKNGVAVTQLHPSGIVLIDGKKIDVVTEGELIEKGERVNVVRTEGNRVIVKRI